MIVRLTASGEVRAKGAVIPASAVFNAIRHLKSCLLGRGGAAAWRILAIPAGIAVVRALPRPKIQRFYWAFKR